MIRIYSDWKDANKMEIFDEVNKVLTKRKSLWERYSRGISISNTTTAYTAMMAKEGADTSIASSELHLQILFEKFIVDLAAGYLSGEITYDVEVESDIEKKIATTIFGKKPIDTKYAEEIRFIISTIAAQNKDQVELTNLFRDALLYGSCYERVQEDTDNKYRYYSLDALNTVAVWNDDVEPKLVAVVSRFKRRIDSVDYYYYRVYLPEGMEIYSVATNAKVTEKDKLQKKDLNEDESKYNWNKIPVVLYESDFSIIDRCSDIIVSYEALLNNVRNTYQYNDVDCKMKIVGYRPQNPITIPNPKYKEGGNEPQMIVNPARELEDEYVLKGKTFYVQEHGDAGWMSKPISAADVTTMLKYYVDSIFQMCGIPNTGDLAFNSTDLNASAIDRKFYVMNIATSDIREGVTLLIRDRLKMLLDRINLKHSTDYSVDNVNITIKTNLPSMTDENIERMMQLNGLLSEETVITKLGYDYQTEKDRKEKEIDDSMERATKITEQDDEQNDSEEEENTSGDKGGSTNDSGTDKLLQRNPDEDIQDDNKRKKSERI